MSNTHADALQRQNELLKAAIKETWKFIKYRLPISLELEVAKQPTLKNIIYEQKDFQVLLDKTLDVAIEILQETNEPVHYSTIVELVKARHPKLLQKWTRNDLGDKANLNGKVRDLASQKWLVRVAKGMYFYGPRLAEKRGVEGGNTTK